jgi:hypothetical protein
LINDNEKSENGNHVIGQLQDPIEIDGNNSFVSDQLTNPMETMRKKTLVNRMILVRLCQA